MNRGKVLSKLLSLFLAGIVIGLNSVSYFVYSTGSKNENNKSNSVPDESKVEFTEFGLQDSTYQNTVHQEFLKGLESKENKLPKLVTEKEKTVPKKAKYTKDVKYAKVSENLNKVDVGKPVSVYGRFIDSEVNLYGVWSDFKFDFRFINNEFIQGIDYEGDILKSINFIATNFCNLFCGLYYPLYCSCKPTEQFNFSVKNIKDVIYFCVKSVDACFDFQACNSKDKKIFQENVDNYSQRAKHIIYRAVSAMTLINIYDLYFSSQNENKYGYKDFIEECFVMEHMLRTAYNNVEKVALFRGYPVERMRVLSLSLNLFRDILIQFSNANSTENNGQFNAQIGGIDDVLIDILGSDIK